MTKSNIGKRNRQKGHALERFVSSFFKSLGLAKTKTSRQASRLLDDCGIDICFDPGLDFFPFLIQCKAGYDKPRIKPDMEIAKIKERITENFGAKHPIHKAPILIMNKIDGYKPERFLVTMCFEDFKDLMIKTDYVKVVLDEYNDEMNS